MQILFPDGKEKVLTFSYDDGQIYDRRLVQLFNKYRLKGTFHLNSALLGTQGYVGREEVEELYEGMEVAAHTMTHPYLLQQPVSSVAGEIWEDRKQLEQTSKKLVRGFSYPFGEVSEQLGKTLESQGMEYARTVQSTKGFGWPEHFLRWNPTCHHNEVTPSLLEHFLKPQEYEKNLLFYIWGHSFEFEREQTWDKFEEICRTLADQENVWYAANIEVKEYITAVRHLCVSTDQTMVYNPASVRIYYQKDGQVHSVLPGEMKKM